MRDWRAQFDLGNGLTPSCRETVRLWSWVNI